LGARGGGECSVQLAHHQCRGSPSPPLTHPRRAAPAAIPSKYFQGNRPKMEASSSHGPMLRLVQLCIAAEVGQLHKASMLYRPTVTVGRSCIVNKNSRSNVTEGGNGTLSRPVSTHHRVPVTVRVVLSQANFQVQSSPHMSLYMCVFTHTHTNTHTHTHTHTHIQPC